MITHTKIQTNFRPNPLQGTYRAAQLASYAKQTPVGDVLSYVMAELLAAQYPIVKADNLCLVNLYSPQLNTSLGYTGVPPESTIMVNSGLVLTFALTPRTLKNLPQAAEMVGQGKFTRMWGYKSARDYITVCVPRPMLPNKLLGLDALNVLYNAVGLASINFCKLVKEPLTRPSIQPEDISITANTCLSMSSRSMVTNLPMTEWPYCSAFWREYSHCFIPASLDKDFIQYYSIHLDGWMYEGDIELGALDWIKQSQLTMIQNGLGKLSAGLITGYIDSTQAEVQGTLAMILRKSTSDTSGLSGNASDRSRFVSDLNQKAMQAFQDVPILQSKVIGLLSRSQSNLAKGILGTHITYRKDADDLADYLDLILGA